MSSSPSPAAPTAMELPRETEDYIKESIESSLGLQVSAQNLALKFMASEDARHRLQDQIFLLEERLDESNSRVEKFRAEASMNAQGLKKCIEEKEKLCSAHKELVFRCRKLDQECAMYEQDLQRVMESCDELGKENEELQALIKEKCDHSALVMEIESLKKNKENLRVNLQKAEEEVKVLFEQNTLLDEENKRLLELLKRMRHLHGSDGRSFSSAASAKGKRKSCLKEKSPTGKAIEFSDVDSPDSRLHK